MTNNSTNNRRSCSRQPKTAGRSRRLVLIRSKPALARTRGARVHPDDDRERARDGALSRPAAYARRPKADPENAEGRERCHWPPARSPIALTAGDLWSGGHRGAARPGSTPPEGKTAEWRSTAACGAYQRRTRQGRCTDRRRLFLPGTKHGVGCARGAPPARPLAVPSARIR